jgi:hypothetical protein
MRTEDIARLVGHGSTAVIERVYRHDSPTRRSQSA